MMNFNIVLSSSGFNDVNNFVSEKIKTLFQQIVQNKRVMILANAAPKGTGNYIARDNVKENFLKSGAIEVNVVDLNDANIDSMLDYDVIYGLGGDPTYLIELNRNQKFKEVLLKFLKNGIYIGESAGSMILCDDLKWVYIVKKGTKPKYDVELETYKGLGLIDFNIFPHWNKVADSVKQKAVAYETQNNIKFTKLNDGEFITINYLKEQK
ncbi:MAG TPA: Type 1 glutamine amidotransferase-like domain-containing protein [Bacilli bacterium]|nr:Type 1 glutamine amidotransferase-like domain-containing protein [Bacilli bacterium]